MMRLVLAGVLLLPSVVLAQGGGGPAPPEWYIQMGVHRRIVDGREMPRLPEAECTAMVLPQREENSLGIKPSKVSGPFASQQAAEAKLKEAGWKYFRPFIGVKGSIWHAPKGC
jgi:hypothetical protein